MKQTYIKPNITVVHLRTEQPLAGSNLSSTFGGSSATIPAKSREFGDWDWDEDDDF